MEVTREITVDADPEEVWPLLADPDELAAWVGPELDGVPVEVDPAGTGVRWTWGESTVELTVVPDGDRTTVRVTETRASAGSWDLRLLGLEVQCLLRAAAIPA